jgi:methionyl-tRNA formyltransferase
VTRWRLTIEYDGGPFMGWQRQDHGPSVQQTLEEALRRMTTEVAAFTAAGRTDAGVHATAMTAHVDVMKSLTAHRLREGLTALVRPHPIAILAGDPETGITIMRMEEGLDTGPMLLKISTMIDRKNAGQLTDELARMGAMGLRKWLEKPASHRPRAQDDAKATYAPKIDKAEARIDWHKQAIDIERQVRAFAPAPGAWFEANGERIKLLDAAIGDGASGEAGEVLDDCLSIATGRGCVKPLLVQRAGRGAMTPEELLRGFAVPKGTILT